MISIRDPLQIGVGKNERTIQQFCVVVDEIWIADSRDDSHSDDFLHSVFEFDEAKDLSCLDLNRSGSAGAILFSLGDRDAIEDGRFTNLRQSCKSNRATKKSRPRVKNTQTTSGLVISRNSADSVEVTHFRITNITGRLLFRNDGTTAIANGDFINFAQANSGLRFTPAVNSLVTGHFTVQASVSWNRGTVVIV